MQDQQESNDHEPTSVELGMLIDEHVEEVSVDGRRERRRGIYLLPNLLTTGALFSGFYAIVSAMNGQYESASVAIFVAMFFDGLDGRVARLTNTQSAFGVQYDSLSDMVSFGVAPALVMFSWALSDIGKIGWAASFIYVAGAALRLARFNTQVSVADPGWFRGLASPAAAALLASLVWSCSDLGLLGEEIPVAVALFAAMITAVAGTLMVSNFRYYSFKRFDFRRRVPFALILGSVLVVGIVTIDPPRFLLLMALTYAASGPIQVIWPGSRKRAEPG